jgi:hypothetical protein
VGTENKYPQPKGASIYVRTVKSRKYGDYFQLVRSYRDPDSGTVKKEVLVHLGEHETPDEALAAWPREIETHRASGRGEQADKLAGKLEKLRTLVETRGGNVRS